MRIKYYYTSSVCIINVKTNVWHCICGFWPCWTKYHSIKDHDWWWSWRQNVKFSISFRNSFLVWTVSTFWIRIGNVVYFGTKYHNYFITNTSFIVGWCCFWNNIYAVMFDLLLRFSSYIYNPKFTFYYILDTKIYMNMVYM